MKYLSIVVLTFAIVSNARAQGTPPTATPQPAANSATTPQPPAAPQLATEPKVATECTDADTQNCTVLDAINFYVTQNQKSKTVLVPAQKAIEKEVANANRATTPPSTFAGGVHNSYEDFLNLFSFAINKVEESTNGQALTVRFNPVRSGEHLFGASLTVAQPTVGEVVKSVIPEDARAAAVTALEKEMSNTDDLTWAGSYSPATDECEWDRSPKKRCWGRSASAYQDVLSLIMTPLIPSSGKVLRGLSDQIEKLVAREDFKRVGIDSLGNAAEVRGLIKKFSAEELASVKSETFKAHHLDLLPTLIDNQPQASLTVTYHETSPFAGPSDHGASLELHSGRTNINSMRAACGPVLAVHKIANPAELPTETRKALGVCLQDQLNAFAANGLPTDKYVLTATYKNVHSYRLETLPITPAISFEPIDIALATEFNVKAQVGRQLGTEITGKPMRWDFALEAFRAMHGQFVTSSRVVATLTMSVPVGETITVPITVSYANKPEFLTDTTKRIGMHFGLSYRLPELFGSK